MYPTAQAGLPPESSHFLRGNAPFLVKQEVEEVCRICETLENLVDISSEEFSHLNEKLHIIADFEGEYTYCLKFMCTSCIGKLEKAFEFKVQSEETYRKIISRMENSNSNGFDNTFGSAGFDDSACDGRGPIVTDKSNEIDVDEEKKCFELLDFIKVEEEDVQDHQSAVGKIKEEFPQEDLQQFIEMKSVFEEYDNVHRERSKEVFCCKICGKNFSTKHNVRDHIEGMHMNKKKYECDICGTKFCFSSTLYRHKEIHTDDEVPCDICEKPFKTRTYMKTHRKSHFTSEAMNRSIPLALRCHICGLKTKNTSMLNKHMKIHDNNKPFKCDICEKQFTRPESLKDHIRSHTGERPYPCRICQKPFRYRTHLSRHMLIHTGEKRHICPICNKSYSQSYGLTVHLRSHTGENPYSCSNCSKGFKSRGAMTTHSKRCIVTDMAQLHQDYNY